MIFLAGLQVRLARALGIPAVGEVPNAPGIADPGDAIIVDGISGEIYVRPSAEIESAYAERVRFRARRQAQYSELRDKACVTKDGQPIELLINAGLTIDLPHIEDTGSAGIGLFRTELQFMVSPSLPRSSDQLAPYRTVLDAAGNKPVTFRTLDIGGDKALPYMETVVEENPALGWRAIRLGLDRPGLLCGQIRALLRAGGGRALKIMFPMISDIAEFDQAKAIVERELTYLRQHGHSLPERIDIGTMVEVPALLYQLDELLKKVDFVSVGSNDLFQFLFAVDRGNAKVSERFDILSAPILRALRDGLPYYMLPDMDFGEKDAEFVPFFGIQAATLTATARIAATTGAQVMPVIATFLPGYRGWRVKFYPVWDNYPGPAMVAATRRMNQFIEERVREAPAEYFWTHKRFKTRPHGEPSLYSKH